ncbi:MAG: MBL fold metallo-hydrolase, partial [Oscillospiraceae bacterium]|nr:MBL fold metallo-hydrolase [Oscillospiraceae bacterium]
MKIQTYRLGSFDTNCYLVYDEKSSKACLIDPAVYDARIVNVISSKELSLEYIILTHGHLDHILGVNAFREKTGAKVAAHELETEYLEDTEKSMSGGETVSADILLKENDILTFGDISLRVIHTPGHTKGSCCLVCESEKVIFSGD